MLLLPCVLLCLAGCSTRFEAPPRPAAEAYDESCDGLRSEFAALPTAEEVWLPAEAMGEPPPEPEPLRSERAGTQKRPAVAYSDLDRLYAFYDTWHLTPYRYGGRGMRGIDCSAFVQRVYRDVFAVKLPRTTWELVRYGEAIPSRRMRTGDLVFFKTGAGSRHVGIYLQKGKFMHASARYGVIISNLNRSYWERHYWTARRVK